MFPIHTICVILHLRDVRTNERSDKKWHVSLSLSVVSVRAVHPMGKWTAMLHRILRGMDKNRGSTNKYTKFGQSVIRKISKIVANRCHISSLKCTKFDSRRQSVCPSVRPSVRLRLRWSLKLCCLSFWRSGRQHILRSLFLESMYKKRHVFRTEATHAQWKWRGVMIIITQPPAVNSTYYNTPIHQMSLAVPAMIWCVCGCLRATHDEILHSAAEINCRPKPANTAVLGLSDNDELVFKNCSVTAGLLTGFVLYTDESDNMIGWLGFKGISAQ